MYEYAKKYYEYYGNLEVPSSFKTNNGYEYDENLDKVVQAGDVNKAVYADSDYYDKEGNLALAKGDIVEKDRLEYAKKQILLLTKKEIVNGITP